MGRLILPKVQHTYNCVALSIETGNWRLSEANDTARTPVTQLGSKAGQYFYLVGGERHTDPLTCYPRKTLSYAKYSTMW